MSKTVISARLNSADAKALKERAKSLGMTLPEFLSTVARHGADLGEFKATLEHQHEQTLLAVHRLADQLGRSVSEALRG